MTKPKKVLAFGTFDIFHPGHEFYLKEARKYGDLLNVVVARDSTVEKVKGSAPVNSEESRLAVIHALEYVDHAVLGKEGDKYAVVEDLQPDVICFGYDQRSFTAGLKRVLDEKGLSAEIVRFQKSYRPDLYKSSKLK